MRLELADYPVNEIRLGGTFEYRAGTLAIESTMRSVTSALGRGVELVQILVRIERCHAAGAGGGDRLAVDVVGDVAGGEHAGHARLRRVAAEGDDLAQRRGAGRKARQIDAEPLGQICSREINLLGRGPDQDLLRRLDLDDDSVAERASALEFALEGLHLTKRLNKEQTESRGRWRFQSDL